MKLRIIDYVGNEGGGVRFTIEMIRGLNKAAPEIEMELVSDGATLDRYAALIRENNLACRVRGRPPAAVSANGWVFTIAPDELLGCDRIWLPWGHRHQTRSRAEAPLVVTLHDLLVITIPVLQETLPALAQDEHTVLAAWLDCSADVVVSSFHTRSEIKRVFKRSASNVHIVSLAGSHATSTGTDPALLPSGLVGQDFIFCPFNISPHKNHEVLLRGLASWKRRQPAVLTGTGTDFGGNLPAWKRALWPLVGRMGLRQPHRAIQLGILARSLGLRRGRDLFTVGYVSDSTYYALLHNCWALVMPTLGEGGGSFPVEEALWIGKPVISADIPVMREQMRRLNADVLWFDPYQPEQLVARLEELAQNYDGIAERFRQQVTHMTQRTWQTVVDEYLPILLGTSGAAKSV